MIISWANQVLLSLFQMAIHLYKPVLICLSILFLNSVKSVGQSLRNMAVFSSFEAGIIQQKLNLGYAIRVANFSNYENEKVKSQLFIGIGFGIQSYRSFSVPYVPPSFVLVTKGHNLSLSITNAVVKPKRRHPEKYKTKFLTFRVGLNKFDKINAYYRNYDNSGWTGFNDVLDDTKCNSLDFELMFIRLFKLNSYNYIRLGMNTGIRIGEISGIRYRGSMSNPNASKIRENLDPFILNFSLGYQIHFGHIKEFD